MLGLAPLIDSLGNEPGLLAASLALAAAALLVGFVFCSDCGCCTKTTDNFNRANAATLGGGWDLRAGAFAIASNAATSATANSLAIEPAAVGSNGAGADGQNGAVLVTLSATTAGDQARVVIGRVDDNNYNYALWEFGATDGYLSLWSVIAGTHTQLRGPYTLCGRGVGVTTRLRVCQSNFTTSLNAYVLDPATLVQIFKARGVVDDGSGPLANGNQAGIGTKVVTGTITFEDFAYELTSFTHSTLGCPTCEMCPFCPDTQELCSFLDGFGGSIDGNIQMVRGTNYDDGADGSGFTHSKNCRWIGDETLDTNPPLANLATVYIQKAADGHYYLWGQIDLRGAGPNFCGWTYRADLGTCPPDCATWDCIHLEFVSYTNCPFGSFEPTPPYPTWTVTSGQTCCYYVYGGGSSSSICCDGVTLPASLFVTITEDGAPYFTDKEVLGPNQDPEQYDYVSADTSTILVCQGGVDGANRVRLIFPVGLSTETVTLTVHSCSPYHATGSTTVAGKLYEIEVTA